MTFISRNAAFALAVGALFVVAGTAARADSTVKCTTPQIEVNSGTDGTQPRMTLHCLGGSSAAGINYFAVEISANPTVAQMIQQVYQSYLLEHKTAGYVTLSSDLTDLSGNAWGCSENNCRVLDFAIGQ